MNATVTQLTVDHELTEAREYGTCYAWQISDPDTDNQLFNVQLCSPVDQEIYLMEFRYDDYPEKPYLIEFIHPGSGLRGDKTCVPKCRHDSFFHPEGLICNPCNRKAYEGYRGLHSDWKMTGWQQIANGLINLKSILDAIYTRIADKTIYEKRMA
jgi:hypothetical protein